MNFKKSIICAGALLALSMGSARADDATGTVGLFFVAANSPDHAWTYVNLTSKTGTGPGTCYSTDVNTDAIVSVVASAKATGKKVTMSCNADGVIGYVRLN
jgi:hypothetical protein